MEEEEEDFGFDEFDETGPGNGPPSGGGGKGGPGGKGRRIVNSTTSTNSSATNTTSKLGSDSDYYKNTHFVSDYLMAVGMFESASDGSYTPYGGINKDSFEWKAYNTTVETNSFGLQEMKFDLKDVTLKGTSDSINPIEEVINRLQLRLNQTKID